MTTEGQHKGMVFGLMEVLFILITVVVRELYVKIQRTEHRQIL